MDTRATDYRFHSSNKEVTLSFFDQVVEVAIEKFVPGKQHQEQLMAQGNDWKEDYHLLPQLQYLTKKDETILHGYNAARIPNTNFTAAAGPYRQDELEGFIKNTVYHPNTPIYQVVALGSLAICENTSYWSDFFDYGMVDRTINCDSYVATVKRKSGTFSSTQNKQYKPDNIIESELHVQDKKTSETKVLKVCVIGCSMGLPILLQANSRYKDYIDDETNVYLTEKGVALRKETLLRLYQEYLHKPMLVHCSAGMGRTGEFILMMEILKHYNVIFASNDSQVCAKKIHDILANMRSVRPAMVLGEEQFKSAINNAEILYRYSLDLKARQNLDTRSVLSENIVADKKIQSIIKPACQFTLFNANLEDNERKSGSLGHSLLAAQDSEMNKEAQAGVKRKCDDETDNTPNKKMSF